MDIQIHHEAKKAIRALPKCILDSFNTLEDRLKKGDDLSEFIKTKPYSPRDAVGTRTLLRHYHLNPCKPVCYLVWLLQFDETIYILDVSEHPLPGSFADPKIKEHLYARLYDICPEFRKYKLPGTFRSGFQVDRSNLFGSRTVKGHPLIAPVMAEDAAYLPLGQLDDLSDGRNRVGIVVGSFEIPREEIPDEAIECIDDENHPDRETLTLYSAGWQFHSGIYRKETEQLIIWLCPIHNVVLEMSTRKKPVVFALSKKDYQWLELYLKAKFPELRENEHEQGKLADGLIEHFPLYREQEKVRG